MHNRVINHVAEEGADRAASFANFGNGDDDNSASPLLKDLQNVCLTNGIDIAHLLSPTGFDAWRQALGGERDEVFKTRLASGDDGMGLRTIPTQPPAEGRIVSAEFIVRSGDWHPVEQHFKVQAARGDAGIRCGGNFLPGRGAVVGAAPGLRRIESAHVVFSVRRRAAA